MVEVVIISRTVRRSQSSKGKMSMKQLRVITGALILFMSAVTVVPQNGGTRGVTPEDYLAFEFISDPNISPDGKLVAYVVTKIDKAQNRRNSSIWMAATDVSRAPWQFTTSLQSVSSPRWSSDGQSLAFLSSRPTSEPTTAGAGGSEQSRSQ